jgi:hypothetical protein
LLANIEQPEAASSRNSNSCREIPGVLVARAELRSSQIQDLADQISEITLAAAGLDLKFNIQVEVSLERPRGRRTPPQS